MQAMDYNTPNFRQLLIDKFGKALENDPNFKLTSEPTYRHNCIAFAMGMEDRWVDVAQVPWHWWPPAPIPKDENQESLVKAFEYFGFERCDMNDQMEEGYDKVLLYSREGKWTHAALITRDGVCHSKFGESFDGEHSAGSVLEKEYGLPFQMMKREKEKANLTSKMKGVFDGHCRVSQKLQFKVEVNGRLIMLEDFLIMYKGKVYLERCGNEVIVSRTGVQIIPKS